MWRTVTILILLSGTGLLHAQSVRLQSSKGEVVNRGAHRACLTTTLTFPLDPPAFLTYITTRDTVTNAYSAHPHTHLGFDDWGNMTYIHPHYSGGCQPWNPPKFVWTAPRRGGGTVTQLVIPVLDSKKGGGEIGSYAVRVVQLPSFREWLFLRTTLEGTMPASVDYVLAGAWTAFSVPYAARQGASRFAYVNGRHYSSGAPEPMPAKLEFDGFAVYAVNSVVLDRDLNVVLFDPAQFQRKTIEYYYWIKGFQLKCLPRKESPTVTVALARFVTDNPKQDAERFFAENRGKALREAMASLDWEPEIDPATAQTQLAKAAAQARITLEDAQALERLSTALKQALVAKDDNRYFGALAELRQLNDRLTLASLDAMLGD